MKLTINVNVEDQQVFSETFKGIVDNNAKLGLVTVQWKYHSGNDGGPECFIADLFNGKLVLQIYRKGQGLWKSDAWSTGLSPCLSNEGRVGNERSFYSIYNASVALYNAIRPWARELAKKGIKP